MTFNGKELAKLFGITPGRISQLYKEGILTRESSRYPLSSITQYIKFIQGEQTQGNTTDREAPDTNKERARLLRAQADKAEMDNEVRRGELAPIDLLEECLVDVLRQQVAIFDSIPGEVKRNVPGISNKGIEVVKREVAKARNLAADVTLSAN